MKRLAFLISLTLIFSVMFADGQTKKKKTKRKRVVATQKQENYLNPQFFEQTLVIEPNHFSWVTVFLEKPSNLTGRFTAQGGRNDIECLIVDDDGLTNLRNGNQFKTYYQSGVVTVDSFNLNLLTGNYYIVFKNPAAFFTNKVVKINYSIE